MASEDHYCREKLEKLGHGFALTRLFTDQTQRAALLAVHALRHELREVVETLPDPEISQVRLDWWREEIPRIAEGRGAHPISLALSRAFDNCGVPESQLADMVDGAEMLLATPAFSSEEQLDLYLYRWGGAVQVALALGGGANEQATFDAAARLGQAEALAGVVARVPQDGRVGRHLIPPAVFARHGGNAEEASPSLPAGLLMEYLDRIQQETREALLATPVGERRLQRPAAILTHLAAAEAQRKDGSALPAFRTLWIAWRSARLAA
ncbi:MAG: squalene/phytoene synthase family protein [Gammaproteobacteria bacterium]|jgi:phytoene synthase